MTKLTKEGLRNTKFIVQNEEESKKVQEHLFELGVEWYGSGKNISHVLSLFMFIDDKLILSKSSSRIDYFITRSSKLILASDILEIPLPESKIKVGNFVISKDGDVYGKVGATDGDDIYLYYSGLPYDKKYFRLATPEEIAEIVRKCNNNNLRG